MADLGPKGHALHDVLTEALIKRHDAMRPLIIEAARAVDRLNDLDDIIDGKGVLDLLRFRVRDDAGTVVEVKFDGVLSEARQQQANLANLMKVIAPNIREDARSEERDLLDEIAQRRSARRAGPAKGASRTNRSG